MPRKLTKYNNNNNKNKNNKKRTRLNKLKGGHLYNAGMADTYDPTFTGGVKGISAQAYVIMQHILMVEDNVIIVNAAAAGVNPFVPRVCARAAEPTKINQALLSQRIKTCAAIDYTGGGDVVYDANGQSDLLEQMLLSIDKELKDGNGVADPNAQPGAVGWRSVLNKEIQRVAPLNAEALALMNEIHTHMTYITKIGDKPRPAVPVAV